jgi:hypothetical protein
LKCFASSRQPWEIAVNEASLVDVSLIYAGFRSRRREWLARSACFA